MAKHRFENPEPVPPASQLTVLPFLSGVCGLLQTSGNVPKLRCTIHRTMSREGSEYLQQVCGYLPASPGWRSGAGRMLPVSFGIIGAAYGNGKIWRTRSFPTEQDLLVALKDSMTATGDDQKIEKVAKSYIAVPFLGPGNEVVLILYADCHQPNFFADNSRVEQIVSMCRGFCDLLDELQNDPFPNLRNFQLEKGQPVIGERNVYPLQEELGLAPPKFKAVNSFNYEASVA